MSSIAVAAAVGENLSDEAAMSPQNLENLEGAASKQIPLGCFEELVIFLVRIEICAIPISR